jgi:hypothetical protein
MSPVRTEWGWLAGMDSNRSSRLSAAQEPGNHDTTLVRMILGSFILYIGGRLWPGSGVTSRSAIRTIAFLNSTAQARSNCRISCASSAGVFNTLLGMP